MRWACTPAGIGKPVGYRLLPTGESAAPGEIEVTSDPAGLVLADDLHSLRAPTPGELLAAARERKLAELVAVRDAAIIAPVDWGGASWSALPEDQANLVQTVALWSAARGLSSQDQASLGAPIPSTVPWKTTDNALRDLTYLEAIQLATAISIAKQTMFAIYWQLEGAVAAASTLQEVAAIEWPT